MKKNLTNCSPSVDRVDSRKLLTYVVTLLLALAVLPSVTRAQWQLEKKISLSDTNAMLNENMGRCLAVSGDSVHVVWSDLKTDAGAVFYKHSFDGGVTWGQQTRLSPAPSHADFSCIAVCGATVHVAWRDSSTGKSISYYKRSLDGGNTWGASVSLGEYFWWPSITCSGSMVFVALNDKNTNNTEVYCRRSTDNGTTWDTVHQISNATGRSEDPSIAAGGGSVHLVWNDNRTGIMQTWYRRSSDNGVTWGPETQLSTATTFSYFPAVHTSGPNVDVVFGDRFLNNFSVFIKQSSDYGVTWGVAKRLSSGLVNCAYPVLARNGQNIHVFYWVFNNDALYVRSRDGGATWDSTIVLVPAVNMPSSTFIELGDTSVYAIWVDRREGHTEIYFTKNPNGNKQDSAKSSIVMQTSSSALGTIQLSPNPTTSSSILSVAVATRLEDVRVDMYDAAGRLVQSQFVGALEAGLRNIPLTLSKLSGVGFIRVLSAGRMIGSARIVIAR
jgi:hypothetical protein